MIKKNIKGTFILVVLAALTFTSCQDFLEVEPQDKLNKDQVYRDIFDADAAVVGVYGRLMELARKYVVLNELRADLVSPTENADLTFRELSEHSVSAENPYANPKDFYEVINMCNDILKNFELMRADFRLDTDEFNERYSDIGTLRSWLYLQLGMHYGAVPYITEPIENIDDIGNPSNFERMPLEQLIDELVEFTESLPYTDLYSENSSLVISIDGYNTPKFFINKGCLLGDLQLWNGNYLEAASHYKNVMETGTGSGDIAVLFDTYRLGSRNVSTNDDLSVGYIRFREQDATGLVNNNTQGWRSIFAREKDARWNTEWIWSLPFDSNFAPKNPFIDLFSNQGGNYLLKPSQRAIDLWKNQTQRNDIPYDARGEKFSYNIINDQEVIVKYLFNYLDFTNFMPVDEFERDGDWFLYRAAKLHLRFAEAANRDGQHRLADALLNNGIQSAYGDPENDPDVTDFEQTHLPFPYNFDARQGDFPYYRGDWHRNEGLRGRAYVEFKEVIGDSLISIENDLIEESALELAFEGNRWGDLVRISLRRGDPAFLADKIYEKLSKEGNANADEVRSKLMNTENWYLPFNWKEEE
ncbi:RagB/SusD family nutrient uptake outer membrane protein [Flavisericum labens]|uniref:RagB/SusD family nutrient uptake outer membrane protein n=1 Tax=Flavisericum labens TaxID=3377112 RepID=UPI00387B54D4